MFQFFQHPFRRNSAANGEILEKVRSFSVGGGVSPERCMACLCVRACARARGVGVDRACVRACARDRGFSFGRACVRERDAGEAALVVRACVRRLMLPMCLF